MLRRERPKLNWMSQKNGMSIAAKREPFINPQPFFQNPNSPSTLRLQERLPSLQDIWYQFGSKSSQRIARYFFFQRIQLTLSMSKTFSALLKISILTLNNFRVSSVPYRYTIRLQIGLATVCVKWFSSKNIHGWLYVILQTEHVT